MQNFQDTFKTWKQLFASVFSICITVPLNKKNHVSIGTLHFQIIVPPTNSFLSPLPPLPPLLINFPDISEIDKIDCSICETVRSLVETALINYQFQSCLNLECKLSHFS